MKLARLILGALFLCVLIGSAPSAFALQQDWNGMDHACGSADDCFHSGDWWQTVQGANGTSNTSCRLYGCQTCVDNGYGKMICAYHVTISDACRCDNKKTGSSPSITTCTLAGFCAVSNN